MKSTSFIAIVLLATISCYFSALVIWIDPEFSTFRDLISQGVWILFLLGSILWWVLLVTLLRFIQQANWSMFLIGTLVVGFLISCLISFATGTYSIEAFTKLTIIIITLIAIGVLGSWGLSSAVGLIIKKFPERLFP